MDINKYAKKPELIKVELDDEALIEAYGEPVTFWMLDFLDINTYFDFFKSQNSNQDDKLNQIIRKIILKEDGTPALASDEALPIDISIAALIKINEILGKSKTKSSENQIGTQPE